MHDLRRLRAFHAVAETGSFSTAALELGYAQSVVSHHVAALEREFGLTLVNRGTRPVSVTDAGERLHRHAAAVLGHVAAAEDELRAVAGLESGTLRLGAFLSACHSFVPTALARFEQAHPDVEVKVEVLEGPDVLHQVRSGDLDLAVVWRIWQPAENSGKTTDDAFDDLHLVDDPYRIVLPLNHRLARRRQLRLAELASERFNGPPDEGITAAYRQMVERLCREAGFEPDFRYNVYDVNVARAFVSAGLSVAVLSELMVRQPREDVAVKPVRDIDPFRTIHATWLRDRRVPAVSRMVDYLADAAAAWVG